MPVFLQGRRAFFIIPTPPTSPLQPLISPPRHRFGPCLPAPRLCVPRLPRCGCRLPLLLSPRLPRCGCRLPLLSSPRLPPLSPLSDTEAPHGPQPLPLGLKCRHGPRPFYSSTRSTTTARAPSAVLRDVAQPIPVPALPGAQKSGRNRTEVRPPPKSNQSVAAASPRQVIWLSGKSLFQKVGIRTPGNTRSSPAPKRTVFRYRAALRKVRHQANKATSRRSRTDN